MHIPTMVFRGKGNISLIAEDIVRGLSLRELGEFKDAFLYADEIQLVDTSVLRVPEAELYGPGLTYRSPDPNSDDLNIVARVGQFSVYDDTLCSIGLSLPKSWAKDVLRHLQATLGCEERAERLEWVIRHGTAL